MPGDLGPSLSSATFCAAFGPCAQGEELLHPRFPVCYTETKPVMFIYSSCKVSVHTGSSVAA